MHNLLLVFFPYLNNWSYECPLPVLLLFSSLPRVLNCMQVRDSASHPSVRLIPERHQASISLYQVRDHFYIVHSHNDSLVYKLQKDINQGYKVYLILVLNDIAKVWKVFRGSGYTFMRSTQGARMHRHGTIQQFSIFIVSLPPFPSLSVQMNTSSFFRYLLFLYFSLCGDQWSCCINSVWHGFSLLPTMLYFCHNCCFHA